MDYDYTRNKLRTLFEQTGLTQKDFAQMCELTQSTVTRLLSGKRSPQLVTLVKICRSFKIKPSFFVLELQEEGLSLPASSLEPQASDSTLARAIVQEVGELDEADLLEVLDFVRFRKRQGRRRRQAEGSSGA